MSILRDAGGYSFKHAGQIYAVICLLCSEGWALYVNRGPDDAMATETGHRTNLPASASDEALQKAADELRRQFEAGEVPDAGLEADEH